MKNVRQVQSTKDGRAFAAILADGRVITWGSLDSGDSEELRSVQQVQATGYAFAAILRLVHGFNMFQLHLFFG